MGNINQNRIISMVRGNKNGRSIKDTADSSWRTIISDIYKSIQDKEESTGNGYVSKAFEELTKINVDNRIKLLMTSNPNFKTLNKFDSYGHHLEQVTDNATGFLKSLANSDFLPPIVGNVFNITEKALSAVADAVITGSNTIAAFKAGNDELSEAFAPWFESVQAWTGLDGNLSFNYKFEFKLGQYGLWNAAEEVYKPILNLYAAAMPRTMTLSGLAGNFPNPYQLSALGFKNLDTIISSLFTGNSSDELDKETQKLFDDYLRQNAGLQGAEELGHWKKETEKEIKEGKTYLTRDELTGRVISHQTQTELSKNNVLSSGLNNFFFTLKFGDVVTLKYIMVRNCSYEFSNEVDSNGFPISGSVTMDFESLIPPVLGASESDFTAAMYNTRFN